MTKLYLLPTHFKKVGLIIAFAALLLPVGGKIFGVDESWRQGFKMGFYAIVSIGLLVYILSKEKVEDEFIQQVRLQGFLFTTICAVIGFIMSTLFFIFFSVEYYKEEQLIFYELIMYIAFFRFRLGRYKKEME